MLSGTDLDDDYVSRLLAEDAKKTSHKYAAQGLSAFLPKHRAADVPKPNTRFLRHIVREADNHNAALKKKEDQKSERRLRALRDYDEPPRKRYRADETDQSKRGRMLKDILGAVRSGNGGKHRGTVTDRSQSSRQHHHHHGGGDKQKPSRRHRSHERHTSPDSSRPSKSRRKSSSLESETRSERRKRHKPTPRETSPDADVRAHRLRHRQYSSAAPPIGNQLDGIAEAPERHGEDAVPKRGRGAHRARTGIDARFAKGYDPSHDVSQDSVHDSDAEDWDFALEAVRHRAKWKQSQTSRMREAGFDEKVISKWERGFLINDGPEGNSSTVKWARKGEVREWDAGKTR